MELWNCKGSNGYVSDNEYLEMRRTNEKLRSMTRLSLQPLIRRYVLKCFYDYFDFV